MVDRPNAKLLLVFLTALVSFSAMSISALATPIASDFQIGTNETILNISAMSYNASVIWGFQLNISNRTDPAPPWAVNFSISNVSWVFSYQNDTTSGIRNYTLCSGCNKTNGIAGQNVTFMSNTTGGIWFVNISQSLLGAAGNWNLTVSAWDNSSTGGGGSVNFSLGNFTFYIAPRAVKLNITMNATYGDRTYNFISGDVAIFNVSVLNATGTRDNSTGGSINTSLTNATREILYVAIDSNMTGWVIGASQGINRSDIQGASTLNITSIPQLSNRSYFIRAFLTGGNINYTATNVTVNMTAKDNEKPVVNILKPVAKSAFTESSLTLKASATDNVAGTTTCDYKIDTGSSKSLSISSDISVSDLSNGDHTITVECTDPSSNKADAKVSFSINVLPGSATGGGASTTSTPVVTATTEEKSQAFVAKIVANKPATIAIPKGDISVITVTVKSDVTSVYINVNRLDAKPADVVAAPGTVFRYLDIKPSGLPEETITRATIQFKVEKSWLTTNKVDTGRVVLNRFASGVWNKLNTTKISEDATSVTYEAVTPGFSTFAISTDEGAPAAAPKPAPGTTPKAPKPAPTAPGALPEVGGVNVGIIAVIIIIIVVAIFLLRSGAI